MASNRQSVLCLASFSGPSVHHFMRSQSLGRWILTDSFSTSLYPLTAPRIADISRPDDGRMTGPVRILRLGLAPPRDCDVMNVMT
jgi:hypothetical protein